MNQCSAVMIFCNQFEKIKTSSFLRKEKKKQLLITSVRKRYNHNVEKPFKKSDIAFQFGILSFKIVAFFLYFHVFRGLLFHDFFSFLHFFFFFCIFYVFAFNTIFVFLWLLGFDLIFIYVLRFFAISFIFSMYFSRFCFTRNFRIFMGFFGVDLIFYVRFCVYLFPGFFFRV